MLVILFSLLPIFVLILLGFGLKRSLFRSGDFWYTLEKFIYYIFFPALIIDTLWNSQFQTVAAFPMVLALIFSTLSVGGLTILCRVFMGIDGAGFSAVFMGATRFNTYVGLAAASALYGNEGLIMAALAITVLVPLVNILSILVLLKFVPRADNQSYLTSIIWSLITNPLIIACFIGISINIAPWTLWSPIASTVSALAQAALPLGLLAVGAGLSALNTQTTRRAILWSAVLKLLAMPSVTVIACNLLDVTGVSAQVAILFAALPSASTAYVLARQMGGDAPLMAAIITLTTVAAALTMPLFVTTLELTTLLAQ